MHPHLDVDESSGGKVRMSSKSLSGNNEELTNKYWIDSGKTFVENKSKFVIIFVGDGMSHTSVGNFTSTFQA